MELETFFLIIGAIILTGFAGMLINQRTKIPQSLFLIVFGLALGPVFGIVDGAALLEFLPVVSIAAMVAILVESGVSFDIFKILGNFGTALIFTLAVAIMTTILITGFLTYFFGWDIFHAALLGIVSSGTTTITAMALLNGMKISRKVKQLVLLETIINDLTLILGVFILVDIIKFSIFDPTSAVSSIFLDLSIGMLAGIVFAFLWRHVLENINLTKKLNYASTIGMCFVIYYAAAAIEGNSIIAVFAFSLVLGNYCKLHGFIFPGKMDKEKCKFKDVLKSIRSVKTDFTFFMKSFFFVLLGVTFNTAVLGQLSVFLIAGIILMILLSRLISTVIISRRDRDFAKYRSLITVMIPRGYVAAVLAFVPAQQGIEIPLFTDIVVILVIVTTFVAILGAAVFGKRKRV